MPSLGFVKDPWSGSVYSISAIRRGIVTLMPIGGGEPLKVRQHILDFFYRRDPELMGGM
jgi:hypothetical protein